MKGKILSELQNLNDSNNLNDREFKVFSQFGNKINIEHFPSAAYIVSITEKDNDEKLFYKAVFF